MDIFAGFRTKLIQKRKRIPYLEGTASICPFCGGNEWRVWETQRTYLYVMNRCSCWAKGCNRRWVQYFKLVDVVEVIPLNDEVVLERGG